MRRFRTFQPVAIGGGLFLSRLLALVVLFVMMAILPATGAEAGCAVPHTISNGQVADATAIMDNFNALNSCVNASISPSGSPVAGNLPVFSGANTITSGTLSGDCATAGSLTIVCTKTSGLPFGYFATGSDVAQLTGTISPNRFNGGFNADGTHYLRGDGVWAIPAGGGGGGFVAPSLVQSKLIIGNQPATDGILLDQPATAGNIIVVLATHYSNSPVPNPGWIQLISTNGSASGIFACMKVATDDDVGMPLRPFSGAGNGQGIAVFELENASPAQTIAVTYFQEKNIAAPILKGAAAQANSIVLGMVASDASTAAPSGLTGASSIGEIHGTTSTNSSTELTAFKIDSAPKGAANVTVTYAASAVRYGLLVAIAPQ